MTTMISRHRSIFYLDKSKGAVWNISHMSCYVSPSIRRDDLFFWMGDIRWERMPCLSVVLTATRLLDGGKGRRMNGIGPACLSDGQYSQSTAATEESQGGTGGKNRTKDQQ